MLDVGDLAGLVLEVVNLSGVAFLDHLLPPPREQLTEVSQKFLVSPRGLTLLQAVGPIGYLLDRAEAMSSFQDARFGAEPWTTSRGSAA